MAMKLLEKTPTAASLFQVNIIKWIPPRMCFNLTWWYQALLTWQLSIFITSSNLFISQRWRTLSYTCWSSWNQKIKCWWIQLHSSETGKALRQLFSNYVISFIVYFHITLYGKAAHVICTAETVVMLHEMFTGLQRPDHKIELLCL